MDSVQGIDIFDLFDPDNGEDIDFETAYKMIANFDNDTAFPKDNFDEFTDIGLGGSLPPVLNTLGEQKQEDEDEDERIHKHEHDIKAWDVRLMENERNVKSETRSNRVASLPESARPELLSTYESHAIEHFLDNLIHQQDVSTKPFVDRKTIEAQNFDHSSHRGELQLHEVEAPSGRHSSDEYIPEDVQVPDITIADSEAPQAVINDPKLLRKWKHVEVERLRRNNIKKTFGELIALTKYPRGETNKIMKPPTDKRVPKHTLLSFIVEDMKSILQANQQLDFLLEEARNMKQSNSVGGTNVTMY